MNGYGTWKSMGNNILGICRGYEDTLNGFFENDTLGKYWGRGDTLTGFFRDGIPVDFCIKVVKYSNIVYEINYMDGIIHGRIKHTDKDAGIVCYTELDNGCRKGVYMAVGNIYHTLNFSIGDKSIGISEDYCYEQVHLGNNILIQHVLNGFTSTYHTGHVDSNKGSIQPYYGRMTYLSGIIEFKSTKTTYYVNGTFMDGTKS